MTMFEWNLLYFDEEILRDFSKKACGWHHVGPCDVLLSMLNIAMGDWWRQSMAHVLRLRFVLSLTLTCANDGNRGSTTLNNVQFIHININLTLDIGQGWLVIDNASATARRDWHKAKTGNLAHRVINWWPLRYEDGLGLVNEMKAVYPSCKTPHIGNWLQLVTLWHAMSVWACYRRIRNGAVDAVKLQWESRVLEWPGDDEYCRWWPCSLLRCHLRRFFSRSSRVTTSWLLESEPSMSLLLYGYDDVTMYSVVCMMTWGSCIISWRSVVSVLRYCWRGYGRHRRNAKNAKEEVWVYRDEFAAMGQLTRAVGHKVFSGSLCYAARLI